ncbi:hypothetical protein [Streptomyces sp. NPDC016172]|uniref:hypothetical protein n=1 Tax=Streptomyces sp. NPDC016172 TaxID=3364964 RepID=UPI0036FBEFFA
MPALSARRIASSALCATLVLGVAAPVALAADTARDRTHEAAPDIDAATLQTQVQQLGYLGAVVPPITELMDAALKVENGQLPAAEAAKLGDAARAAITRAATAAQMSSTAPAAPAVPSTPPVSTNSTSVSLSQTTITVRDSKRAAADTREGLAELQALVEDLIAALTSGNLAGLVPAIAALAQGLVTTISGLLGNLPALPGLPLPLPS